MTHPPTPEQSAILDFVATSPSNLMVQAYAGCGKTAILEMIATAHSGPSLLVCFNKSVADEATRRLPDTSTVRTFNSLGHRLWAETCAHKLTLDKDKIHGIFKELVDEVPRSESKELWNVYDQITAGVNLARAIGYIPDDHPRASKSLATARQLYHLLDESPSELVRDAIDKILTTSIHLAYRGVIDFNDQVYMPALFGSSYPRFPLVLIDEYQDLSPVNHAIVEKLCKHSRQIGVGDEAQAIYGFRGASVGSMGQAITSFSMAQLPLSISFRCPSAIVENVHWRVPDFQAHRAGGMVRHTGGKLASNSAVICRQNAPLISQALAALANGLSISVAGTDIGNRLIRQLTKLGPETLSRAQTMSTIDHWLADRQERHSRSASDMAACMRIFVRQATSLAGAVAKARSVFSQTGSISFWSGHKAKGLEFDHVFHLDSDLLQTTGQDPNVHYVIDTRARESLTYISSQKG